MWSFVKENCKTLIDFPHTHIQNNRNSWPLKNLNLPECRKHIKRRGEQNQRFGTEHIGAVAMEMGKGKTVRRHFIPTFKL